MWFDAQVELAKLAGGRENDAYPPATLATTATNRARVAIVADVATAPAGYKKSEHARDGRSVTGQPLTWTGRVVSLADWRTLTEQERHGPNGRHWCGVTKHWLQPP